MYDEISLMNQFQLTLRFLAYIHVKTGLRALRMDINTEPGGSRGGNYLTVNTQGARVSCGSPCFDGKGTLNNESV